MKIIKSTELSVRLKQLIRDRGITQKELAEEIGVSGAAVSGWMKGAILSSDKLSALARYFEMSVDELLTGQKPNYEVRLKNSEAMIMSAKEEAALIDDKDVGQLVFDRRVAIEQAKRAGDELNKERQKREGLLVEFIKLRSSLDKLIEELGKDVV